MYDSNKQNDLFASLFGWDEQERIAQAIAAATDERIAREERALELSEAQTDMQHETLELARKADKKAARSERIAVASLVVAVIAILVSVLLRFL